MNTKDNIQALADRINICILNQSFWNPKKRHAAETNEENRRHGLDRDAEVYIRLTKHENLLAAQNIKGQIYLAHKRLTLPSPCEGMRVVPVAREFEHSETLQQLNTQFQVEVGKFIDDYDNVVEKAKAKFNELFDSSMFPPKDVMRGKFSNTTRYMACPTHGTWKDWLNETVQASQSELQNRIVQAGRHLIDVCSGDGRIFSSVLENLEDICSLAGDLNLMDDPIIAKAAKELNELSRETPIEVLRDNDIIKRETARRTQDILGMLNLA